MIYIKRSLEEQITKYLKIKEILAIVGARQCGKTTLMEHVFEKISYKKNKKFISFEDQDILRLFENNLDGFIEKYIKDVDFLFIDEFQYAKEGGKKLKYIYDTFKTKIIISGSSASDLSIQSIKFLVGRIFVFQLNPLSFDEFLYFNDSRLYNIYRKGSYSNVTIDMINKYYEEFIIYGGYPRVVLTKNKIEKEDILKNIYNTYLLKEIKEILQLPSDYKLNKLINILVIQSGGLVNYNELSDASGFNYLDLLKHLNILKKTFICVESRPYFTNKKKELVKNPKFYFLDNGFRNYIIKNFQELSNRTDLGNLNENFIASELVKKEIDLKYWRSKAGAEVDFIVYKNGNLTPIEIKTMLKHPKITRSFRNFLIAYKQKKGYVLSRELFTKKKINNTEIFFYPLFSIGNLFN